MMLPYVINVALILGACVVFYKLLLRRETFYRMNRYLLVICLGIAFALPLLKVPEKVSFRRSADRESIFINRQSDSENSLQSGSQQSNSLDRETANVKTETSRSQPQETKNTQPVTGFSFGRLMNWALWIYWFGVGVFGISFLFQVVILLWRAYRNPVIIDGKYRIVEVKGDNAACSFGNNIFINPEKYDWDTYNQILLHEKIHIEQKHTLDIVLAELVLIFQWFNPFAWVYRREIESNLEFLTDDQLMQYNTVEKKSYQLSLMKVSAPHFPLSLTTNYNQSILKKRIAMMNRKKSNVHTGWKYFFLLPVLAFLACLLNEPVVSAQSNKSKESKESNESSELKERKEHGMKSEGYWFAIIKDEKVHIRFSDEKLDDENFSHRGYDGSTFKLSELGTLPKGSQGTFSILREAGKMELTGKFEGNTGMGTYKFIADKNYVDYMNKELNENLDDNEQMAFFFINIKKEFLTMLKSEGYTNISKDDLIPVAALGIDQAYIRSMKKAFKDVTLQKLIPLKALSVDEQYVTDIRSEYKDITTDQLVSFKGQKIDKEYIHKVREMKGKDGKDDDDADNIVSYKAMDITPEYVNSFKAIGLNVSHDQLISFKALGITPEYIKGWQQAGFKDIEPEEFTGMKAQNVTVEYMKSFTDLGFKNIRPQNLVAFRALGITPEWVRSFESMGYKNLDADQLPGLKAQNITPEFIKSFEAVGFKNIELDEIVAVKAVGVTPEYIKEMRSKGFNYNSLQKYVTLKSID